MKKDLVSIITANYNSEKFVAQTIESVLAQTYVDWEMIIVDDGSTDRGMDIIQFYTNQDGRIRLIQLDQNSGPAVARNKAIEEANGAYIAFLDSDDLWLPYKLERQIAFMMQYQVVFSYSAYNLIDEDCNTKGVFSVPERLSYTDLLKTNSIGCLTAIYDTRLIGKVMMPLILKRQDYGLWLKILKMTPFAYGINEPFATYRIRKNSISSNKIKAASYVWKVFREVEKINFFKSIYYFAHYAFNGFKKYS